VATRCFSHVTLMLPQDEVDDDRHLTRGARVRDLAQSLAALHQKDFGDLLGTDDVRYHVVGADELAPGEVEVKFGHAVYLPAPGEPVLYTVSASRDSAVWKPVCPVYQDQRLTLLAQDERSATRAVPGWPFGPEGAILLINDGPGSPLEVQMRPKDAFDCSYDPVAGYYTVRARGSSGGPSERLLLKIARATSVPSTAGMPVRADRAEPSATAPRAPAVWKTRSLQPQLADATAVPAAPRAAAPVEADTTYAPVGRQRVTLAALALPRLSRYRDTGAQSLEIGLDRTLGPVQDGKDALISFAVDDADQVHAVTAAGRERIAIPASFTPVDGVAVRVLAPAPQMADRYCALLCLPQAPSQSVAAGARFVFGRSAPVLAALRVLDSARCLRRAAGFDAASADRLGLSRSAFSFEATGDGYQVCRLSPTQALYHLDDQLRYVGTIGEGEHPYRLPAGHHLVAGHYVLRFDA
jgi:hypothetical protein